jgi:hypothetical protein
VYAGSKGEYFYYTTPEAAKAIDTYLQYRYGEKLMTDDGDSYLFREQFNVEDILDCKHPKKIYKKGLEQLIYRNLQRAGLMAKTKLKEGEKLGRHRNKIARTHGFRKFVNTTMVNARLNDTIRNMLLGHSTDLDDVYYKPKPDDLLQEYLKVVDMLTINEEHRLRRKVQQLTVRADKLELLHNEIQELKDKLGL